LYRALRLHHLLLRLLFLLRPCGSLRRKLLLFVVLGDFVTDYATCDRTGNRVVTRNVARYAASHCARQAAYCRSLARSNDKRGGNSKGREVFCFHGDNSSLRISVVIGTVKFSRRVFASMRL
jgi:hypothetical protein